MNTPSDESTIKLWNRCTEIASECGLTIELRGGFRVSHPRRGMLGAPLSVEAMYYLLCGYDWGVSEMRGDWPDDDEWTEDN